MFTFRSFLTTTCVAAVLSSAVPDQSFGQAAAAKSTTKKPAAAPAAPAPKPTPPVPPAIKWSTTTKSLTERSALEVRFGREMVPGQAVGDIPAQPSPVTVSPSLKGQFYWRSTSSGVFQPQEAPALGQMYAFNLREGLTDLAGAPVQGQGFMQKSASLMFVDGWPDYFQETPRVPEVLVVFNAAVQASSVGGALYWTDKSGQRVKAATRQAMASDFPPAAKSEEAAELRQHAGLQVNNDDKEKAAPLGKALFVTTEAPLPPGDNWVLAMATGLPGAEKGVALADYETFALGDIQTMEVRSIHPSSGLGEKKQLTIAFRKDFAAGLKTEEVAAKIKISPAVPDAKFSIDENIIQIDGGFDFYKPYTITVAGGFASEDGLVSPAAAPETIKFEPETPVVALPAITNSQLASGNAQLSVATANLQSLSVRVKSTDRNSLLYALRAFRGYTGGETEHPEPQDEDSMFNRLSFDAMPGAKVWEKNFTLNLPLNREEQVMMDWKEISKGTLTGGYFITAEGSAKAEWLGKKKRYGAQAFVQITDIGLMWKVTADEAVIMAFSQKSGQPLKDVLISMHDEEARELAKQTTGADGVAVLPRAKSAWLMAELGQDRHAVPIDEHVEVLGMWRMGVPYDWEPATEARREVVMFTERPLYQPGETVYLKAYSRQSGKDGLSLPPQVEKATLKALDPKGKVLAEREITFSAAGSFDAAIELPAASASALGSHHIVLSFPPPPVKKEEKPADETNGEAEAPQPQTFEHYFLVEEYKPNTFQISYAKEGMKLDGEQASLGLEARYFLGKTLSKAKLDWTAEVSRTGFTSEAFERFNFLDSRDTYFYDAEGYHEVPDEEKVHSLVTGQGKTGLTEAGTAALSFTVPEQPFAGGPRRVRVTAEVTDINQQTITERYTKELHPSDFYLGMPRFDAIMGAGQAVPIELCAAQAVDGAPWKESVQAKVIVEKLSWNTVRVQTTGGGTNTRSDLVRTIVAEGSTTVPPKGQPLPPGQEFAFTPKEPGFYYITAKAADKQGRAVESITSLQVYGEGWADWDREDGVKIDLVADQEEYTAGQVAKVLVKSPMAGPGLVTVERRSVIKRFPVEIKGSAQIIEVPIESGWAPNVFVSVFITRGADQCPRQYKEPEYKVGFCQLKVKDVSSQLQVSVSTGKADYEPGQTGEATATVTSSDGKPIAGAEVTFWAVDEGILSLTEFEQPDPWKDYHRTVSLAVQTGTSLMALLPENPKELEFTNKGYVIGGGGMAAMMEKLRKAFKPVAFWQPNLMTDAVGKVTTKFTVPDNLTQFRLIAVASHQADQFGTGKGQFRINKPLMLEPAVPRFANVGDQIGARAVIMNTTKSDAEVEVTLALDDKAKASGETKKAIKVAAGGTEAVVFPVQFSEAGSAVWKWTARSMIAGANLSDAVQSTIEVEYPSPWLRETLFAVANDQSRGQNLLAGINPELLQGKGEATLIVSNSTLAEVSAAIGQLLHYPYGCAEQTTSSTLPWLALQRFPEGLPGLKKTPEQITKAMQAGANRLLSMQTANGGLAYWSGGTQSSLWASAYGGMGLALLSKAGVQVPATALADLAKFLSESLRQSNAINEPTGLVDKAQICYTLALLGKAEPAYHASLEAKSMILPHSARALLALATLEVGGSKDDVIRILDAPMEPKLEQWSGNLFNSRLTAINLLVWAKIDSQNVICQRLTDRLLKERRPHGGWGCTYENAWSLLALAEEAAANSSQLKEGEVTITFDGKTEKLRFTARPSAQTVILPISGTAKSLTLDAPAGGLFRAALDLKVQPQIAPQLARNQGLGLSRKYQKLSPDGTLSSAENLEVGDLVVVELSLNIPNRMQYLAVDAPLPSILEPLNQKLRTQQADVSVKNDANLRTWWSSHEELRKDRALFFADEIWSGGAYRIQHLARVAAEGTATAPPAKIEAMYSPEVYGLSASETLTAKASGGKVAGK